MKCRLYATALIAISAAAFLPMQSMAQVNLSVVIGNAPPPPRFESVPQPRPGHVWAPGYWNWDGQRHVWIAGQWQPERGGYRYQRAEWVRDGGGWRLDRGGWIALAAAPVARDDYVRVAPPPPRHERMPHPRRGYVWAPGHWEWHGQRHEWLPGMWLAERPDQYYSPANWVQRDGRWYLEPGRWVGHGDRDHGRDRDRDHDGVPDRREHDGGPNRHDRDGDGVPNRYDQHPDNPRRD